MKQNMATVIVSAAAFLLCGVVWLALPWLQDSQRAVETEAAVHMERARRLLHGFEYGLARKSVLHEQLTEAGVDVAVEDPQALVDAAADGYQQRHARDWETYQPMDWAAEPPRAVRAGYGDLVRQVQDGLRGRDELSAKNERLLDDAMESVEQALAVAVGNSSSRSHAEAQRLLGVILYHQGLAEWLRAAMKRREAEPYRRQLAGLAISASEFASARTLVTDTAIDGGISDLDGRVTEIQVTLSEHREALAALDATIGKLEARLADAESQRNSAQQALDKLRAAGIDFSAPDAAARFQAEFLEANAAYRTAEREARLLEVGRYPNAEIDFTGDFVKGSYVEGGSTTGLTIEHGVEYYRNERTVLAAIIEHAEDALDGLRSDIQRLQGMKVSFQREQDRAHQRVSEATSAAKEAFSELNRIESEAFVSEDAALASLERAASASEQATANAKQWVLDATERTRDLSPDVQQRSAHGKRTGDGWMGGFIAAQAADARLAMGWIHLGRYQAYTQTARILGDVAQVLDLAEADLDDEQSKAAEAHDTGVEEITRAIAGLEQAHRDTGRHWTLVAQEAGAMDLLALFGHPSYEADAVETYRSALSGREEEPYVLKLVSRLKKLEAR